jgi:hypothetical protein
MFLASQITTGFSSKATLKLKNCKRHVDDMDLFPKRKRGIATKLILNHVASRNANSEYIQGVHRGFQGYESLGKS